MKKLLLLCVFAGSTLLSRAQVVSLNEAELNKLKQLVTTDADVKAVWNDLLKTADEALTAMPNPADTILTEGILQGDPRKTKTQKALADMPKVYALALAYKVTGRQDYLKKTDEFLLAWATRNQPMGNPINDTNLDRLIFAYDLVKKDLRAKSAKKVNNWLEQVAVQEIKTYDKAVARGKGVTFFNNWHSHRIKEVAEVAWAIEDGGHMKHWVRVKYKEQIANNLRPDGSSFDFHERDALHYHIYDVDPLLVAATVLDRDDKFGENPYTYQSAGGNSLKAAVNWLLPYFTGEQTHGEFVNSKVAFDKKRAQNGEKGYIAGTPFKPAEARTSMALASYFEPRLLHAYQQEGKTSSRFPNWQFVLNELKQNGDRK